MDANAVSLVDWTPIVRLALMGIVLALGPLAWIWMRHRGRPSTGRLHALTVLTLFLTFDLVLFGAFTRLTDSGLGCPDWPGCYGSASPLGARADIQAAETAMPTGPVTHGKAWVEMVHRYVATAVGVLITVIAAAAWLLHRRGTRTAGAGATAGMAADAAAEGRATGQPPGSVSPWWATATLVWVILQGAFGALTVTMKLYPAIVTLHLLGGIGLLVLLAVQDARFAPRPLPLSRGLLAGVLAVALLALVQTALGGWVSTNYAVLACTDFPTCQGSWWPAMDFEHAFVLRRALGVTAQGEYLPFAALTAIHYTHRLVAYVLLAALLLLAVRLRAGGDPVRRRFALGLALIAAWQLTTGLSNIVLGWPLAAAVAHTGGAAALAVLLTTLLARAAQARRAAAQPLARPLAPLTP